MAVVDVDEFISLPSSSIGTHLDTFLSQNRFATASMIKLAWLQFSDQESSNKTLKIVRMHNVMVIDTQVSLCVLFVLTAVTKETLTTSRYEWRAKEPLLGSVTLLKDNDGNDINIIAGKSIFRPTVFIFDSFF